MSLSFCQWLENHAQTAPESNALIINGDILTYKKLLHRVQAMATSITKEGNTPGSIHIAHFTSAYDMALRFYATPRAACALLPIDPNLPVKNKEYLTKLAKAQSHFSILPPDPEAVHLIIATSGTTGIPKGVMLSGKNLAASAIASRKRIQLLSTDRWLACLPLVHIGGLSILARCAQAGASVVLQEDFDAEAALTAMDEYGITHISVVPTMLHQFLEKLKDMPPPGNLKTVLVGGAALSKQLADRAIKSGWPLFPTYGMSETSSQCLTQTSIGYDWQEGQAGTPLDDFHVRLENERLAISGPAVMVGYLNAKKESGHGLQNGVFISNDLATQNEDGNFTILGRSDDTIIIGGKNIHPVSIETVLKNCPGIQDLAISSLEDPKWGQVPIVLYCGDVDEMALLDYATHNLKGLFRPRKALRVSSLPRNTMGKLERLKLKNIIQNI